MTRQAWPRVGVVYHFYPHYRRAVVEALARSEVAEFTFLGDDHEYLNSIEPAVFSERVRFELAPTHHMGGPFMWQWRAISVAWDRRFDTLIFHPVPHWPCTWIGAILARLLGKRVLFWGHGYLAPPKGWTGFVRRALNALPHAHMFYGRRSRVIALDLGWPPELLHVIYNSQDTAAQVASRERVTIERRREIRRELFDGSDAPVLFCTSRLIAMRKLDLLLRAAGELGARGKTVNVLQVGDGPDRARLEALARELGVRVHFAGACYDEARLAELAMTANLTVSPGRVGLTVTHSLVYGVPVVTHYDADDQAPEFEAVVPGETGGLFEKDSVASLADAITPWIASEFPNDATRTACQRLVDRFWNPDFQRRAIERAVLGEPAIDPAVESDARATRGDTARR